MAIKVKAKDNFIGEELNSKLGALGLEIVFDEEDEKILEPKNDKDKNNKNTKSKKKDK